MDNPLISGKSHSIYSVERELVFYVEADLARRAETSSHPSRKPETSLNNKREVTADSNPSFV